MKTTRTQLMFTALAMIFLCGMTQSTGAQNVDVRVSAREAYVGMPIVLQLSIQNATDYQAPAVPTIDGCDVRPAGAPAQGSQITIINGRRLETRSVTMQYLITPRREGTFEIPSLTVNVNGRDQTTQPLRFVATRSETGDLLFVEIEGGKDKVFVGQPLDLTLKIWLKPFVDRENNIKLSEANMWQMLSPQTSWGSFAGRLQDLAENNQRPGGQPVLRDDGNGTEREYYLYEITATVYPKRAGQIDANDVQVVVNYPTGIGKARDPFDSLFGDSPFGGNDINARMSARIQQMMGDDFFGGSPFGNRLSITSSRPIVGQATVDSTRVVPVPSEGRPADYRGAVGRYKIVTQATPTHVSAGDPITLNIGILGTGPMELVQAPPLTELPSLTTDFKVEDQSLAGFVKDETKVFPTTIRPRREGITQVPAIPFSFFDPDTETFQTVMSEPISISVDKSESLALDAIVGNHRQANRSAGESGSVASPLEPNFTNDHSPSVLASHAPKSAGNRWWLFVVAPPFAWFATLIIRNRDMLIGLLPSFQSAEAQCLTGIDRAKTRTAIEAALVRFVSRNLGIVKAQRNASGDVSGQRENPSPTGQGVDNRQAVGALRTNGLYQVAGEVESFFLTSQHSAFSGAGEPSLEETRQQARELTKTLNTAFSAMSKSQVRRSKNRNSQSSRNATVRRSSPTAPKASVLLMAVLFSLSARVAFADDTPPSVAHQGQTEFSVQLSDSQCQTILKEAGEQYTRATEIAQTDQAEGNDLFTSAAARYQLLVDSGIHNADLYTNLGNAYLQSNQLGRAIAQYEHARTLDPSNQQLAANLKFANTLVKNAPAETKRDASATSWQSATQSLRSGNDRLIDLVGLQTVVWMLAGSSLLFWSILVIRAAGCQFSTWRWTIAPFCVLMISLVSVSLAMTQLYKTADAIIVTDTVVLHAGDGEQFPEVASLDSAQGHRVTISEQRGTWTQVKTAHGQVGWMESRQLETL